MIYDFTTHCLYNRSQNIDVPQFSLAIDTLEMFFELQTGKLLCIQGYFPLIRAEKCNIHLPVYIKGDYLLHNFDLSTCNQNEVYDITKKLPQTQKYFKTMSVKYDVEKGIIQIGEEMKEQENVIEVNDNILCGLDQNLDLKCVYLIPDKFV